MYNTTTAVINNNEFSSNYMPVGINDSVLLKEVNTKKSTTGKDFLEIIFENKDGQTASMSEWKNEKNQWIKTDEELQARDNAQFGRLMQIINCYYPTIEDTTLNSFSDMINWVKSKLDPMISTEKSLRLKVVYDKRGYTTVSSNGIFVEPMDTEQSQIKLFKKDLLERPIQADNEKPADPLAGTVKTNIPVTSENSVNSSDLPF
uniref:Uncharacterized protein n=1 Tax=Dulem virus 42 TaxID=3145760 RepID=A0AAU8B8A9_9CAUD